MEICHPNRVVCKPGDNVAFFVAFKMGPNRNRKGLGGRGRKEKETFANNGSSAQTDQADPEKLKRKGLLLLDSSFFFLLSKNTDI